MRGAVATSAGRLFRTLMTVATVSAVGPLIGGTLFLMIYSPIALLIAVVSLVNPHFLVATVSVMYRGGLVYAFVAGFFMGLYGFLTAKLPFWTAPVAGCLAALMALPIKNLVLPNLSVFEHENDFIPILILCSLVSSLCWFPVQNLWNYDE